MEPGIIPAKHAVEKAAEFLREIQFSEPADMLVEEVELSPEGEQWRITLSFRGMPLASAGPFAEAMGATPGHKREFRTILVRASDGEVEGMKTMNLKKVEV